MSQPFCTASAAQVLRPGTETPVDTVDVDRLVVLAHGFDVPGDDLFSLAFHLASRTPGARFVLPEGPVELRRPATKKRPAVPEVPWQRPHRAWWTADAADDEIATATLAFSNVVSAAGAQVAPEARIYVGGFSQGAGLAARAKVDRLAGLVVLAPPRVDETLLGALDGVRVFVASGALDDVAPRRHSDRLATACANAGAQVDLLIHSAAHEMTLEVADALAACLLED